MYKQSVRPSKRPFGIRSLSLSGHFIMIWLLGILVLLAVKLFNFPLNKELVDFWILITLPIFWLFIIHQRYTRINFSYIIAMSIILNGISFNTFAASTITHFFQQGAVGYTNAQDTKLKSGSPSTNYGTDTSLELDGSPDESSLLYWDLASIPAGSIILSVDITVDIIGTPDDAYEIYELKRPWKEGEDTWNDNAFGHSWELEGADGLGYRGSTALGFITGLSSGLNTISLNAAGVAVVQSWVDNPSSNQGFIVVDYTNSKNLSIFFSRETGTVSRRPKLTATYLYGGFSLLSIDDVVVTGRDSGIANDIFTITLSSMNGQTAIVDYSTAYASTKASRDYISVANQVSFQPVETFLVELRNPFNATSFYNQGQDTISDDDPAPINVPADFATIQDAIDAAVDGGNILVAPGFYPETIVISGKSVVLASWFLTTGDTGYITQTVLDGGGTSAAITIDKSAGPTTAIIGLTIQNADNGLLPFAKFHILNCRIRNTNDGIDYEAGSGGLCKFNIFENNHDDGIDLDHDVDIIIEDNIVRNNDDDGIEIRLHPYIGPMLNYIIRNNEIYGNGEDGIQLIDYDTVSNRFFIIERNLIYDNTMAGIGCMGGSISVENYEGASIRERIHLFNNTFVANNYGIAGCDNLVALNNVFVGHRGIAMKNVDGSSIVSYGIYWNNRINFEHSNIDNSHILFSDPLLSDQFHLQANSPAIDAGVPWFIWQGETILSLPSTSYNGTAPEFGAFELESLSIDDIFVAEGDGNTVDVNKMRYNSGWNFYPERRAKILVVESIED